jgi:DNA-binding NtrC family response regulator
VSFSPAALEAMQLHDWPGNVRELQNAIERAVVLGASTTVEPGDLPRYVSGAAGRPRGRSLAEVERAHIQSVLEEAGWNITHAASLLEVDRGTLYNKIRKYELTKPAHGGR